MPAEAVFDSSIFDPTKHSYLAWTMLGELHELQVLKSGGGFYLGASDLDGPISRDSDYYPTEEAAATALKNFAWQQRATA